jgi:hypothetical protein
LSSKEAEYQVGFWRLRLTSTYVHMYLEVVISPCNNQPWANPTIVSYNASVVKFYNATSSLVRSCLPDFSWYIISKCTKLTKKYQMVIKYPKGL